MPNYCDYHMKIRGRPEDCNKFIDRLRSDDEPNHFYRIFEVEEVNGLTVNGIADVYISGYCTWSLESCCRASGYSHGIDLFSVNTKELGLIMEAYSRETGMRFEEHYIYKNGECVVDESRNIDTYYWNIEEFPTYQAFKNEYPDAPPEECFEYENEVYVGGFGEDFANWHI